MSPGAENWSGWVYFTENLAAEDCFGPAALKASPSERQVVRRGTLVHSGLDEVGVTLTDPSVFRNCYTVLRPVFDPYFADLARRKGACLITGTTVTALLRRKGRVAGVQTDKGALHAGVVFLAEGDASHLVRSERLERRERPQRVGADGGAGGQLALPARVHKPPAVEEELRGCGTLRRSAACRHCDPSRRS